MLETIHSLRNSKPQDTQTSCVPLDSSPLAAPGTIAWIRWTVWGFLILGVCMRVLRYLLRFPLWGDEAALAANFLDRGYLDLLRPLDFQQVAPPAFLWVQLALVQGLGFNEWSLRAFPFCCSLASLFLFRHVAFRMLTGIAPLLAVAVFSVSYYPLRHGVEVKPYASDLLIALVIVTLAVKWSREPRHSRWLWCLCAAGPASLAFSHPAAFVAGAVSIALLPRIWRDRHWGTCSAFAVYNIALVASFGALFVLSTGPQMTAARAEGIMHTYWAEAFPPITKPFALAIWFFQIHMGQLFAYPTGGADTGTGALTFICFVTGAIAMLRQGHRLWLSLCIAPFVLTFVAATLQRYPYGGFARTAQHLAPLICLLAGAGAERFMTMIQKGTNRFRTWRAQRSTPECLRVPVPHAHVGATVFAPELAPLQRRILRLSLATLAFFAASLMLRDIVHPYRSEHDRRVREFARWFWNDKAIGAELVCARTDLGLPIFRDTYLWRGIAQYLCNQRIYSPRHGAYIQPRELETLGDQPLRCVVFSRPGLSRDEAAFQAWLARMQQQFAWVGYERNEFFKHHDHGPDIERIEVFEFARRPVTDDHVPPMQGALLSTPVAN